MTTSTRPGARVVRDRYGRSRRVYASREGKWFGFAEDPGAPADARQPLLDALASIGLEAGPDTPDEELQRIVDALTGAGILPAGRAGTGAAAGATGFAERRTAPGGEMDPARRDYLMSLSATGKRQLVREKDKREAARFFAEAMAPVAAQLLRGGR